MPKLKTWVLAIRPKTLPAGAAPIFLGTAMAYGDGIHHWISAWACLWTALWLQISTNLANDYFDCVKGADTEHRQGPTRVTQAGLVQPGEIKAAIILAFGMVIIGSIWLVLRAGWPIAILAIFSILSGLFYTAGPRPLGYLGLGEVFVLIFFGPVAVGGTYYVQSFELHAAVIYAGIAAGLISAAILVVNNLRDIETDRVSGKNTLAVRFGRPFAQAEYFILLMLASLMPAIIYYLIHDHIHILMATSICLWALPGIRVVFDAHNGPALNRTLAYTAKLLLIFTALFSIGWML